VQARPPIVQYVISSSPPSRSVAEKTLRRAAASWNAPARRRGRRWAGGPRTRRGRPGRRARGRRRARTARPARRPASSPGRGRPGGRRASSARSRGRARSRGTRQWSGVRCRTRPAAAVRAARSRRASSSRPTRTGHSTCGTGSVSAQGTRQAYTTELPVASGCTIRHSVELSAVSRVWLTAPKPRLRRTDHPSTNRPITKHQPLEHQYPLTSLMTWTLTGRIRALGRIRGSIVHWILPKAAFFPDLWSLS
jgi:hypothetical protein